MEENGLPTIGEKRVRTSFNVSGNEVVDKIKVNAAQLINFMDYIKDKVCYNPITEEDEEVIRLINIAQERIEEGAMWAVKAATVTKSK